MNYLPKIFKIVSWNMQGSGGFANGSIKNKASVLQQFMNDERVVAICLQECANLFNWGKNGFKELVEFRTKEEIESIRIRQNKKENEQSKRYDDICKKDSLAFPENWEDPLIACDPKGRLNCAILVRKSFAITQNPFDHPPYTLESYKAKFDNNYKKISPIFIVEKENPPVIGAVLHGFSSRKSLYLFCYHVPFTKYKEKDRGGYIQQHLQTCSKITKEDKWCNGNWICVGDFNYHLGDTFDENLPFKTYAQNIRRSSLYTTKAHEYDYAFVGGTSISSLKCNVNVKRGTEVSDHYPVVFEFVDNLK